MILFKAEKIDSEALGGVADAIREKELKTISIKDEQGKEYKFEKPEFECELLYVDKLERVYFVSYNTVYSWRNNIVLLISTEDSYDIGDVNYKINLTLIKPKWCEDKSNFPAFVYDEFSGELLKVTSLNKIGNCIQYKTPIGLSCDFDKFRLATKEEVMSLFYDGKE